MPVGYDDLSTNLKIFFYFERKKKEKGRTSK